MKNYKMLTQCFKRSHTAFMHFVYILQSINSADRKYVGVTNDLDRRLSEHNKGLSVHTNKYKPWTLMTYIAFNDLKKAQAFELYLKSHSGRAFAKKHF